SVVICLLRAFISSAPITEFLLNTRDRPGIAMLFLNIATGIVLILLGMRYLRKGLDRLFGSHLIDWLQRMTEYRYQAFLAGLVAGTIAPSSSAIALLSVQMLNQSALPAGRMLGIGL